MGEQTIIVKRGEDPIIKLIEELKQYKSAWVFLSNGVVGELASYANYETSINERLLIGINKKCGAKVNAIIYLQKRTEVNSECGWNELIEVSAYEIEFKAAPGIPEAILLFEMEE